ncbi:MAG: M20/M25/M40 family metallo-hydrolase, partial [Flavobacteriia bacterium]|nr:M20/M25/M40 family metallo-hydrolase [Flavobacteriia bacterium]
GYSLQIKGLTGGHSGMDIHLGRGNANLLMARLLRDLEREACILLSTMAGGNLRNAIPRECQATVVMDASHAHVLEQAFGPLVASIQKEYQATDPMLEITLTATGSTQSKVLEADVGGELAKLMRQTYVDLFQEEPHVNACHAGLECGIIGEKCPGMEMISFGPNIRGAHSPDERVEIASVQKSWDYYVEILKRFGAMN